MKKILFFLIALLITFITYSQSTGYLRYDTVRIKKEGGNSTLIIENATRNVIGGVLTNTGGGRTEFVIPTPGSGSGISQVLAGYGLTQINDSTFTFSTALRDSIIGLIVPGLTANSFTTYCNPHLFNISTVKLIDSDDAASPGYNRYNGFPSLTKTMLDTLIMGYVQGSTHPDSGTLHIIRSPTHGVTWGPDSTFEASADSNWRSLQVKFLYQDDRTQLADTGIATAWNAQGNVYYWRSIDNGETWSARTKLNTGGRKTAIENKAVKFKGAIYLPAYFFGTTTQTGGVFKSTDGGVTFTGPVLFDSTNGKPSEFSLIVAGDSLIMIGREGSTGTALLRSASVDGTTWTVPIDANIINWLAGKPAVLRMPDGRFIMNGRSRETPNLIPDGGRVWISSDKGINWIEVYEQEYNGALYDFNYGDIEYIGGDKYINVYAGRVTAPYNTIFKAYWEVAGCEVLLTDRQVEKIGDPLWYMLPGETTIPGDNNQTLFSDGNEGIKVISGFGIISSKFESGGYVYDAPGAGTNSQIGFDAGSATGVFSLALGKSADATNTGAHAIGNLSEATGQHSSAVGYQNIVSGLRAQAFGNQLTASHNDAILIGASISSDKTGQLGIGNTTGINEVWIGKTSTHNQPEAVTIRPSKAPTGTANIPGADLILQGSAGTDAANPGNLSFRTASVLGTSDGTLQTQVERVSIHGDSTEIKSLLFINKTFVGDTDDSILVKGANEQVYAIAQSDFAASVNDTITILTPYTGVQIARSISPDSLFIKSDSAGYGMLIDNIGDSLNRFTVDTATLFPVIRSTIPAGGAGNDDITIGTETITGGANTNILYNNSGVVGEYTLSGTGTAVAMATSPGITTAINPITNDAATLGTTSLMWSDLFLASGGVINFNNGDVTLTHVSDVFRVAGGTLEGTGGIFTHTTNPSSNFGAVGGTAGASSSGSGIAVEGATQTSYRAFVNGTTSYTIPVDNYNYASFSVGATPVTEGTTGKNHPLIAGLVVRPPTVTAGVATVTNAATVYIEGPTVATTTNPIRSLWVKSGLTLLDSLEVGTNVKFNALTPGVTPVVTTGGKIIDGLIIDAAPYTPTLTNNPAGWNSNAAASAHVKSYYTRVGSIVTVFGSITVDATAGSTNTAVAITLPVASALTADTDIVGTAHWNVTVGINYTNLDGEVYGDAANDRAIISFNSHGATVAHNVEYSFSYEIK